MTEQFLIWYFSIGDLCLVLCSHRSHQFAQRIRVSQQEKCLIFIFIVFYLSNFLNINTFFVALFSKFGANIKNIENLNINPWLSTYFIKKSAKIKRSLGLTFLKIRIEWRNLKLEIHIQDYLSRVLHFTVLEKLTCSLPRICLV